MDSPRAGRRGAYHHGRPLPGTPLGENPAPYGIRIVDRNFDNYWTSSASLGIGLPVIESEDLTRDRIYMFWQLAHAAAGKESAYALHVAQRDRRVEVVGLLATVDEDTDTVAYTAVPVRLAQAQTEALALPLHQLRIPARCPPGRREDLRRAVLMGTAVPQGVRMIIFGDVATDIRASRAARLAGLGIDAALSERIEQRLKKLASIIDLACGIPTSVRRYRLSTSTSGSPGARFAASRASNWSARRSSGWSRPAPVSPGSR